MFQADLDDQASQLKNAEDDLKKAAVDVARLAEELRQEKDRSAQGEKQRRALESQVLLTS